MIENEFRIKTKPGSLGNPQADTIIEIIYQVLENLVHKYNIQEKYVDDSDSWMGIIAAASFALRSTHHRGKGKSPSHLFFGGDIILPINYEANWWYIREPKQAQIDNYVIRESTTRIYLD